MEGGPRDARMDLALGCTFFAVGYFACFFLSTALPTPLPWYYPLEHRFAIEVRPHGLAADFYGRVLYCLVAGAGFALLGQLLLRRAPAEVKGRWLSRAIVWSASLLLFTAGLYAFALAGRSPNPEPLPPGYVPR